jgi:flagellar hook-associated protein 1 FlgK
MAITKAIGNAFSGLTASARAAELVARNIANATTPGYTAKGLAVSAEIVGGEGAGVRVDGVVRAETPFLTAERRRADSAASRSGAEADTLRRLSDLVLDPGGGDALADRYVALESSLRALADTPESPSIQHGAAEAAGSLARRLNMLSTETTRIRRDADREIQRQVEELGRALQRIEALNRDIQSTVASGRDATALQDERDRLIDTVNGIVPIRASPRENGGVAIASLAGATLFDGKAFPPTFTTGAVPDGSGPIPGGLTWRGQPATPPASALFGGGSLEAAFAARDVHAPAMARQLDALARDLIVRLQNLPDHATDDGSGPPPVGLTGLFTDGGGRYDETDATLTGLAGRIRANPAIDPRAGGDPTRLAAGDWPGALAPQPGAAPFPIAALDAFRAARAPDPVLRIQGDRGSVDLASAFMALVESAASRAEADGAFLEGSALALRAEEKTATAVDTDAELKNLLAIEKAYAANARVLQTVDEMLRRILEI